MEAHSVARAGGLSLPRSRRLLARLGDDRLVEQVRRGNDAAFEAIYDRYSRGILGFCRHMLGSQEEAEDAVQHTFIQAYDSMRGGDREIKLKAWLYTIARNRGLSMLRARREHAAELDDIPTAGLSEAVHQRSELRDLLGDIHELPEDQRAALVLSEVGDLSHADIASVVGCEAPKVKSLVFQARSSLIESRNARELPCHEIREQLATATGGALRRGPLRRHVKQCSGCAEFKDQIQRQRKLLAVALPVVPTLALKHGALAAVGIGSGASTAGGGAAGGGLAGLIGTSAAVKAIAVVAVTGAMVGGGVAIEHATHGSGDVHAAAAAAHGMATSAAARAGVHGASASHARPATPAAKAHHAAAAASHHRSRKGHGHGAASRHGGGSSAGGQSAQGHGRSGAAGSSHAHSQGGGRAQAHSNSGSRGHHTAVRHAYGHTQVRHAPSSHSHVPASPPQSQSGAQRDTTPPSVDSTRGSHRLPALPGVPHRVP